MFIGIDWGSEKDVVSVVNAHGKVLADRSFSHSAGGIAEMVTFLRTYEELKIAIETPYGPIVESLLEHGLTVFVINPRQLDRFRDRFTLAGAKDDSLDARVLADSLRTDEHCFRRLSIEDPWVIELREWSRIYDELGIEEVRQGNRLREHLNRYYPQILECGDVTEEWILRLCELAPTPAEVKKLTVARVRKLLREARIRRLTPDDVLTILRGPAYSLSEGTENAASAHVRVLLPQLRLTLTQRHEAKRKLEEFLKCVDESKEKGRAAFHQDIQRFQTLPGAGIVVVSVVMSEAARPLAERNYDTIRSFAGVAPVTRSSGKKLVVVRRHSCNPRLSQALYHWARTAIQNDPGLREKYARMRARGHTHGRALRGIGDKLLSILCAMLKDGTDYRPTVTRDLQIVA